MNICGKIRNSTMNQPKNLTRRFPNVVSFCVVPDTMMVVPTRVMETVADPSFIGIPPWTAMSRRVSRAGATAVLGHLLPAYMPVCRRDMIGWRKPFVNYRHTHRPNMVVIVMGMMPMGILDFLVIPIMIHHRQHHTTCATATTHTPTRQRQ